MIVGVVEERGAELLFLPSYSPDFSPIEEAFSKLKSLLRRAEARTKGALLEAIGWALEAVTSEDAQGWFGHCGTLYGINSFDHRCREGFRRPSDREDIVYYQGRGQLGLESIVSSLQVILGGALVFAVGILIGSA